MPKLILIIFTCVLGFYPLAQTELKGNVKDAKTSKSIPFSKIYFVDMNLTVLCDSTGAWSITEVPEGLAHAIVSAPGYETIHKDIELTTNQSIDISGFSALIFGCHSYRLRH